MTVAVIVVAFLTIDSIIVWALVSACVGPIRELGKQFVPVEPGPGGVRRNFQSFRFGLMNAGWSMHVTVDEQHLHLHPSRIMRLFKVPALSIPWTRVKRLKRGRWYTRVMVSGDKEKLEVQGPTWCLELASD